MFWLFLAAVKDPPLAAKRRGKRRPGDRPCGKPGCYVIDQAESSAVPAAREQRRGNEQPDEREQQRGSRDIRGRIAETLGQIHQLAAGTSPDHCGAWGSGRE